MFMATQSHIARKGLTMHSHDVALPYRGDGVAYALRQTYQADKDHVPLDMIRLLAAIDDRLIVSARG